MLEKKYELVKDMTLTSRFGLLYKIRALKDFSDVKKGDLGGYVSSERNLSHYDNCWIYGEDAIVAGNAYVNYNARVYGYTVISGNSKILDNACVGGNTVIYNAEISDNALIGGRDVYILNSSIEDNAVIIGLHKDIYITNGAIIGGEAKISDSGDYIVAKNFGDEQVTSFKTKNGSICVKCGRFYGTLLKFKEWIIDTYGSSKITKEYLKLADLIKFKFTGDE